MEPISYPAALPDPRGREPIGGADLNPAYRGPVPFAENVRLLRALESALPGYDFDFDPFAGGYFLTSPVNGGDADPYLVFGNGADFGDDPPDGWRADRCTADGPVLEPDGAFGVLIPGAGYDPAGFAVLARRLDEIARGWGIVSRFAAVAG